MRARDIMTSNLHVVMPDEPITAPAALMADYGIGLIPVISDFTDMKIEGVITDRDIVIRHVAPHHSDACTVRDHMTKGHLNVVRPTDHVHEVIDRMHHDQLRRVLVVDSEHRLLGIIARADVARRVGRLEPVLVETVLAEILTPTALTDELALAGV